MYLFMIILSISSVLIKTDTDHRIKDEIAKKYQNTKCGSDFYNNNTNCYHKKISDDIPYITERKIAGNDRSIFFIDTSCNGGINFRQACCVEAAARRHPDRQINLLFAGPVAKHCLSTSPLWDLLTFANVNIYRIYVKDFLRWTPLEKLIRRGGYLKFPTRYLIDILRYVVLYKFGGIYLDLDVIVVRPLNKLPYPKNWVGKREFNQLGLALLALSKRGLGRNISTAIMRILKINLKNKERKYGNALTEVLQRICNTSDVFKMSSTICRGFEVYHPLYFYPIKAHNWKNFFKSPKTIVGNKGKYAYHTWEQLSHSEPLYNDSLYSMLMNKYCPRMFNLML